MNSLRRIEKIIEDTRFVLSSKVVWLRNIQWLMDSNNPFDSRGNDLVKVCDFTYFAIGM